MFGGLLTIPNWGYECTPIAELDVMMSDLPHVMYHPKQNYSEEYKEATKILRDDVKKKVRRGGLAAALGLDLSSASGASKAKVSQGKVIGPSQSK